MTDSPWSGIELPGQLKIETYSFAERSDRMTVDTTARAEVILEEPEEDEAFGKEDEDDEDDDEDSEGEFKKERMTSFEERMLAANPEVIRMII